MFPPVISKFLPLLCYINPTTTLTQNQKNRYLLSLSITHTNSSEKCSEILSSRDSSRSYTQSGANRFRFGIRRWARGLLSGVAGVGKSGDVKMVLGCSWLRRHVIGALRRERDDECLLIPARRSNTNIYMRSHNTFLHSLLCFVVPQLSHMTGSQWTH